MLKLPQQLGIMAHQKQCCTAFIAQAADQLHGVLSQFRIQITRGFVCKHEFGLVGQSTSNGDSLLLTDRQLRGPMLQVVAEPDFTE